MATSVTIPFIEREAMHFSARNALSLFSNTRAIMKLLIVAIALLAQFFFTPAVVAADITTLTELESAVKACNNDSKCIYTKFITDEGRSRSSELKESFSLLTFLSANNSDFSALKYDYRFLELFDSSDVAKKFEFQVGFGYRVFTQ